MNMIMVTKELDRKFNNKISLDKFRFKKDIGKHLFKTIVVDEWNRPSSHMVCRY